VVNVVGRVTGPDPDPDWKPLFTDQGLLLFFRESLPLLDGVDPFPGQDDDPGGGDDVDDAGDHG
jgi:hypothetical protein